MRIMQKLATALRGGVRETAEMVIDANSLRIFAQEIHECEMHIKQTKQHLAQIIAEKMRIKREMDTIKFNICRYEKDIATKLEQGDEAAAMRVAQCVADKEPILDRQEQNYHQVSQHEQQLQKTLKNMVSKLENYQMEYRLVQATAKMQDSQDRMAIGSKGALSHFGDMQDSVSRIKERQQKFADQMTAMEQIDAELAGGLSCPDDTLIISAKDILERVKQQNMQ